jgi:hypothetical protein
MRDAVPTGAIGVLVKTSCGRPLRAHFDPSPTVGDDDSFSVELRMAAWLAGISKVRVPIVPEYLKRWIPLERAMVIPMYTPVWQAGFLIVEPSMVNRERLQELTEIAVDFALELETADRQYRHQTLQEMVHESTLRSVPFWLAQRQAG